MIDRRDTLRFGISAAFVGLIGRGVKAADQKLVLKASDVHPEGYPTVQAVQDMGKKLEAATGGRLSAVLVLFGNGPSGPDLLYIQRSAGLRRHARSSLWLQNGSFSPLPVRGHWWRRGQSEGYGLLLRAVPQ